jgi:hypothetical protein
MSNAKAQINAKIQMPKARAEEQGGKTILYRALFQGI